MNRPPAVAGSFYPAHPEQLQQLVNQYLNDAKTDAKAPKAIIAPHAGYIYSAPIAASAYARLASVRDKITRVVLIGPSHRVGFQGLAVSQADSYSTPLGTIPIDRQAIQSISQLPFVQVLDQAHSHEHSLEVQLPFLQTVLTQFQLVPIVAGDATALQVAQVLAALWGGDETLIVISSDLSHYHDYATAQHLDQATSHAIENLDYEKLNFESACGRVPVSGLMKLALDNQLKIKTIDLRNSGDTAGDKQRVVGYGAYIIELPHILLEVAKKSIQHGLQTGKPLAINLANCSPELTVQRATFVTLEKNGQLRGCIGMLNAVRPLIEDVAENAFSAAFKDPRFPPVNASELNDLEVHISILSPAVPMTFSSEADLIQQLVPNKDGLILQDGARRGTFLPSVWAQLPDPVQFLRHLKQKAGLPPDYWSDTVKIQRYYTEIIE